MYEQLVAPSYADQFATVFSNQQVLMTRIMNVEQLIKNQSKEIKERLDLILAIVSGGAEKNAAAAVDEAEPDWNFDQINNEDELTAFVHKLESGEGAKLVIAFAAKIGKKANTERSRMDCALQIDRLIFTRAFWTKTAWSGGRPTKNTENAVNPDGEPATELKFAFSKHAVFINFFNKLVKGSTGDILTDEAMKLFAQGRSRNSFYEPKTNQSAASRSRAKQ